MYFAIQRSSPRHRQRTLKQYSESIYCEDHLVSLPQELPEEKLPEMDERVRNYFEIDENRHITSPHLKRRILCLICKSAYHASPDQIRRTAQMAGVSAVWLEAKISALRATMSAGYIDSNPCPTSVKSTWPGHGSITSSCRQPPKRSRRYIDAATPALPRGYGIYRGRSSVFLCLLLTVRLHRELNIPKGSVDSGLHYLKSALSRNLNNKKPKEHEG